MCLNVLNRIHTLAEVQITDVYRTALLDKPLSSFISFPAENMEQNYLKHSDPLQFAILRLQTHKAFISINV